LEVGGAGSEGVDGVYRARNSTARYSLPIWRLPKKKGIPVL